MSAAAVHIIDDDAAMRASLSALLEIEGYEVTAFADGLSFLAAAPALKAGCVLLDIRMAPLDGLAVLSRLRDLRDDLPVVMMTGHADVALAVRSMKAGAVNFIEKPFGAETLIDCVAEALAVERHRAEDRAPALEARRRLERLTEREREVLMALVEGMPNKGVAQALGISPRTVEVHRARLMEKLGVSSIAEAVRIALAAAG
ncbi:MAG: response regulator transcription factor [Alphaproteobacteria bacterium]|nr:response regulator transcription factor [Alphaproteobacteria bacterium]